MRFVDLKNQIRAEAEAEGIPCSSRQAHSIARIVKMRDLDEDDFDRGLSDLNLHSDPTAAEAIRNVMRQVLGLVAA